MNVLQMNVLQKQEINQKIAAIIHPGKTIELPQHAPDCGIIADDVYYNWMGDREDWAYLIIERGVSVNAPSGKDKKFSGDFKGVWILSDCPFEAVCLAFLEGSK